MPPLLKFNTLEHVIGNIATRCGPLHSILEKMQLETEATDRPYTGFKQGFWNSHLARKLQLWARAAAYEAWWGHLPG